MSITRPPAILGRIVKPATRVLIVCIHPLVCEGVKAVLAREDGLDLAVESCSLGQVHDGCSDRPPDLIVVDLSAGCREATGILTEVRHRCGDVRIVALTDPGGTRSLRHAVATGAHGLVSNTASPEHLLMAIRTVLAGGYYVDPHCAAELVSTVRTIPDHAFRQPDAGYESLSAREREIFAMLADGMNNKAIAYRLGLSPKTVEAHYLHIRRKLGFRDGVDLIRYAARIGVIDLEDWTAPARID